MPKLLYILLDGASDGLKDITALSLANKPYLDELARKSKAGIVYPIERGIAPESDSATISMLGYNPKEIKVFRGVLEAIGAGLDFKNGDLALRGNFATVKGDEIIDRRAGRDLKEEEAKSLAKEIKEKLKDIKGYEFDFVHTLGHRCVLVIKNKGKPLGSNISNLDPAYIRVGDVIQALANPSKRIESCKAFDRESYESAELVNLFYQASREILEKSEVNKERIKKGKLPANAILLRDAGSSIPTVESFKSKFNLDSVCLADMPVELGIAKMLGMDVFKTYGFSYEEKSKIVKEMISKYDLVFVHIKGPDEPGHDGDLEGKVKTIEEIDRRFFSNLISDLNLESISLLISCDHSTPPSMKSHSDDPVPFIFFTSKLSADNIEKFSEKDCEKGSLGTLEHGYELLNKVLSII